jgi:hypothetical protein
MEEGGNVTIHETPSSSKSNLTKRKQDDALGTTSIPLARVKRIVKQDRDVNKINADAAFGMAKATVLVRSTKLIHIRNYLFSIGFRRPTNKPRKTKEKYCKQKI